MGEFHEVLLLLFSWSFAAFPLTDECVFSQHMFYFYRIKRVVLESETHVCLNLFLAIARSFFARSFFARLSGIR